MNKKMQMMWQRLIADRRRFSLFCTLLFVGLLLWARIIVIARPPRTAVASPEIEASIASIITSDKTVIPVLLETEPDKNPFSINSEIFPIGIVASDNKTTQFVDTTIKAEQELVATLELEAIMGKIAMINGRVIKEGEVVVIQNVPNPLRLTSLSGRSVIISSENRRYELTIAPPRR
jgi:hypothetical protein